MGSRKYYQAYEDRYQQVHSQNLAWFMTEPSRIVWEILERYSITQQEKLLEIGCGEGRDAGFLLEQGYDLLATDVSETAVAYCRRKWPCFAERFRVVDCACDRLQERFDLIYAVAVIHMLVEDADRRGFYAFVREQLAETGIALICTMGDGETERKSDISTAFALQDRIHEQSGRTVKVAGTSYRAVSFSTFQRELEENGLKILEQGFTDMRPDYFQMMYAVVTRS